MIFASIGTMNMPFFRMAKALDEYASHVSEDIVVQTGYTDFPYKYVKAFQFCTKEKMHDYMERADILILQGGWGVISEGMELNKPLVVMPRHNNTEHIHDQFQLVRKLDDLGCVLGVFDKDDLGEIIQKSKNFHYHHLHKGDAEILIREKLEEWFGRK